MEKVVDQDGNEYKLRVVLALFRAEWHANNTR